MTRRSAMMLTAVAPLLARAAQNQEAPKTRASPHETVSVNLDGKTITITYGRPYLKGRHVGDEVAPYGKVWRLGADEATKITVTAYTLFPNGVEMLPGSYSLFAIPNKDKWTLIVNKVADQWGAFKYDASQDLGRIEIPVRPAMTPVEEFTISLDKVETNLAKLQMVWDTAAISTSLKVL